MTIVEITDHDARALARLIEQFKKKPRISGVLSAVNAQTQELEGVLFGMLLNRSYANAEGQQLDNIGGIVGLTRVPGDNDATYRMKLAARISQNTGFGTPENIIALIAFVTGSVSTHLTEVFPALVFATIDAAVADDDAEAVVGIIQSLLPAGVRLGFVASGDDNDAFVFEDGVGHGFGDYYDRSVGGKFAYIIGGDNALIDGDDMASKNLLVTFAAEATKDVNIFITGMDAQKCSVQVLDTTSSPDPFETAELDVTRPDSNTIRLTAASAISKTFRLIIVQAGD